MSELGDVLELMHRAPRSFRTVRLTVRQWTHEARARAAYEAERERPGTSTSEMVLLGDDDEDEATPPRETTESRLRLWLEPPDRAREEHDVQGHKMLVVVDGPQWWSYHEDAGAMTNGGDPGHQHSLAVASSLLNPMELAAATVLELSGRAQVAGRDGIRLRAAPRDEGGMLASWRGPHERYDREVVVDAERGLLLRSETLYEGEPFAVTEVVEIAFDEEFRPETFVFEPPPGVAVRNTREARPFHHLPLHEVAARAPFTVLAAETAPSGWEVTSMLYEGLGREADQVSVNLSYATRDGGTRISVNERAGTGRPLRGAMWRTVERDGTPYHVADDDERGFRSLVVVFERDGTRVQLTAQGLDADALVEFAAEFRPAPTEPPSIR